MPLFTVISDIGTKHGYIHLTQHEATSPAHAVASHLGQLPVDIGDDEFIDFLQTFLDPHKIRLRPAAKRSVWAWLDAAQHVPQIVTYVVETA
jgi:hypothetical protein